MVSSSVDQDEHLQGTQNWGLDRICTHIQSLDAIVITTHPSPDGDAIGSVCALGMALSDAGFCPVLFNVDPVPSYLTFVPGADLFQSDLDLVRFCDGPANLLVLDASDSRVLPKHVAADLFSSVVAIDHHRTIGDLGKVAYRDEKAAATGVLIYRILKTLGLSISQDIATALYVAISSDTGSFRFQNTDAECFSIANELVSLGANPGAISTQLAPKRSCAELKHIGHLLSSVVMLSDNKIAVIHIDENVLIEKNLPTDLGGGVVQLIRQIPGVELAVTIRQLAETTDTIPTVAGQHVFKVSMRSAGNIDVSQIAACMGGGGHFYAAGATVEAQSFASVHEQIVDLVGQSNR